MKFTAEIVRDFLKEILEKTSKPVSKKYLVTYLQNHGVPISSSYRLTDKASKDCLIKFQKGTNNLVVS